MEPTTSTLARSRKAVVSRAWFPFVLLLAAVALYVIAGTIQAPGLQTGHLGPWFWPRAMLLGLMLACGGKIIGGIRHANGTGPPHTTPTTTTRPEPLQHSRVASWAVLSVLGYVLLSDLIGFALATFLFLVAFIYLGGWRRKLQLLLLGAAGTVSVLYLFIKVVYLPLPKGRGILEDLTIALYRLLRIF
jgi:hypothetical protein